MSLTAGMWTGVSGLLSHGEKMNVIGNNIANVNTVGFKGQRMDFADFIYQDSFSTAGITQIGRGVGIGAVMGNFGQGSFETTTEATDLAIGGRGFFKVQPQGSETSYYTRAGNFRFNNDGYLVDPHGYALQGWKIDNTEGPQRISGGVNPGTNTSQIMGTGEPTDIRLDTWTVEPLQTTNVSFSINLSSDKSGDKSQNVNSPFTSLFNIWNGKQPSEPNNPSMPESAYSYQTSIKVYDEAGGTHTLTVYFDQVSPKDYKGGGSGESVWEYVVTMDPSEDNRQVSVGGNIVDIKETKMAGMLMSGTLSFDSSGKLANQSAYSLNGSRKPAVDPATGALIDGNGFTIDREGNPIPILDVNEPAKNFYPAEVSNKGFPMIVANFTGVPGKNTAGSVGDATTFFTEIDFGLKATDLDDTWKNSNKPLSSLSYEKIHNPMDVQGGWTVAGYTTPAPSVTELGMAQLLENPAGVMPKYYFANPNYDSSVTQSPPYVYKDEASYQAAYQTALAAAGGTATDIKKEHWPHDAASGVLEANDPPNVKDLANMNGTPNRLPNAFTNYAGGSSTKSASQNGYGFGDLMNYSVNAEGVLFGIYSNGVQLPLYQVALYDFNSKQGLRREGGNLFSQTRESGDPSSGAANTSGFGSINANTLEGSNVDISTEFVSMIATQRGFQSNSKIVTTIDQMLETVVTMKR